MTNDVQRKAWVDMAEREYRKATSQPKLDVVVYSKGIVACSACAPKSLTRDQVEAAVNDQSPTGLDHGWSISDDETFKGGQPNPCQCEDDESRQHFLLHC